MFDEGITSFDVISGAFDRGVTKATRTGVIGGAPSNNSPSISPSNPGGDIGAVTPGNTTKNGFSDTQSHWAKEYIGTLTQVGIISGYEEELPSMGWFVRQDWLDKLGLEQPTNVDEFYNVLKAFREGDPNGNGEKDEIPYFHRLTNEAMGPLVAMHGARPTYYVGKDKKIHYGPLEDVYFDAYKDIAKWYAEGLIDKEIFTRGGNARAILLGDNTGGCTHDWFPSTSEFNAKLANEIPGFKFSVIAPPGGVEIDYRGGVGNMCAAISSSAKNKELAMKWIDFWFSPEGSRLAVYGIEGRDYTMVDGKPVYTDTVKNSEKGLLQYIYSIGGMGQMSFRSDPSYEMQYMPQEGVDGMNLYESEVEYDKCRVPVLSYTKEEEKEITRLQTDISTFVSESTQKWVLGTEDPIKAKDSFLKNLDGLGIDRALEIMNAAYARMNK